MRWVQVDSSAVERLAYDEPARELHIVFARGRHYRYFAVGPEEALGLLEAASIGDFVNRQIKPNHACEEVIAPQRRRTLDPPGASR